MKSPYDVIIKPIITEKTMASTEEGKYTFVVAPDAEKPEIKAAAEKAGVTPSMSVSDICDAMKTAMTQITVDGLTSSGMTWSAEGEPTKEPKAVVIKNGEYVLAE